jgi:hypothetical protein
MNNKGAIYMTRNELLGKNLKKLREKAGIKSQRQLSDLCGWTSQSRVKY